MRVAIQGTYGSFSEAAGRRRWPGMVALPGREAQDVGAAIRAGGADAGAGRGLAGEEETPARAASAARPAAAAHGLVPRAERIEDAPPNQPRFLPSPRADAPPLPAGSAGTSRYKTSLIVLIDHKP